VTYEALKPPRFRVEDASSGEIIRIRAPRKVFVIIFLPIWLAGWSAGGSVVAFELTQRFEPFLALWLCGWALGWVFAAGILGWTLFGCETIRTVGGDLELGQQLGPWVRRKLYQGAQVRGLRTAGQNHPLASLSLDLPFRRVRYGALQFNYGARTIYAATGLDEAEGELIVDRLRKHLPRTATNGGMN